MRPADRSDVETLVSIVNAAYGRTDEPDGWTSEEGLIEGPRIDETQLEELRQRPGSHLLVAEQDGHLVGCVHLQEDGGASCELGLLSIDPSVQDRGVGRWLLSEAEAYAGEELGAERIVMHVITAREQLLDWYERRGYERTGKTHPVDLEGEQRSLVGPLSFEVLVKDVS